MGLSDTACRTAKVKDSDITKDGKKKSSIKLPDGTGLYLMVNRAGKKYWRYNYRFGGKSKTIAYGRYPSMTLAAARDAHAAAQRELSAGRDPMTVKKSVKQAALLAAENSFKSVAQKWLAQKAPTWSATHEEKTRQLLERDVYPVFGAEPIHSITAAQVLAMARGIEARGNVEMPRRSISAVGQVLRYAIGLGLIQNDPSQGMAGQLNDRPPVQHYAHVGTKELPGLLRALDALPVDPTVLAVRLDMLTFVRGGELRNAEWSEFDIEAKVWRVPPGRMKGRKWAKENGEAHIVPLAPQAVAILKELGAFTGHYALLFPGRDDPTQGITGAAMAKVWARLGLRGQQTTHGLRGLASTQANGARRPDGSRLFDDRLIEAQLSHKMRDRIKGSYDHAEHIEARTRLMLWWADYLDTLRAGGNVIPLTRQA
ncbi:MAG TPA: integrase arm-type DNA-binding domain-containing protein [Burkholderiaceae bacterium]|nr:integrase arm-type DNA-binding domain-containing protein [Burkholderiaceae bacterium]